MLPENASKGFNKARELAAERTNLFADLSTGEMPTLHEIRALSSHLYARAGYAASAVQELVAHTDPDMTRAYQKGHARKVLRVEMLRPLSVTAEDDEGVREDRGVYRLEPAAARQEIFPENFLAENRLIA